MPYLMINHANGPIYSFWVDSVWTGLKSAEEVAKKRQNYDEAGGVYNGKKMTFEEYLIAVHTDELCAEYDNDW